MRFLSLNQKIIFPDNLVEELSKEASDITSSDTEHAVRWAGVQLVTALF